MNTPDGRQAYLTNSVVSAPPERLLTMLYDALVNNIAVAEDALEKHDFYTLNQRLVRSQEIVLELRASLKPELWSGGPALAAIYTYVYGLLVKGNVHKDPGALSEARKLLEPLQSAWHQAADIAAAARAAKGRLAADRASTDGLGNDPEPLSASA
ncbi:MAG: flagellar export chaperone FliS [Acidimicrobiales bacterium]